MPIPNKNILTLTNARKFEKNKKVLKFIQSFKMQAKRWDASKQQALKKVENESFLQIQIVDCKYVRLIFFQTGWS